MYDSNANECRGAGFPGTGNTVPGWGSLPCVRNCSAGLYVYVVNNKTGVPFKLAFRNSLGATGRENLFNAQQCHPQFNTFMASYCAPGSWIGAGQPGVPTINTTTEPWSIWIDGDKKCNLAYVSAGAMQRMTLKCELPPV